MIFFDDATNAIRAALAEAPRCVGYRKGAGWFLYDGTKGCPLKTDEPEFFAVRQGCIPLPLGPHSYEVLSSIFLSALAK